MSDTTREIAIFARAGFMPASVKNGAVVGRRFFDAEKDCEEYMLENARRRCEKETGSDSDAKFYLERMWREMKIIPVMIMPTSDIEKMGEIVKAETYDSARDMAKERGAVDISEVNKEDL